MTNRPLVKIIDGYHYGKKGRVLNCHRERGEFYYLVEIKKEMNHHDRVMLHESQIIIL